MGIGGKDIAEGMPKLTLAIVWQLMRADVLQFLESRGFDEKDIHKWANRKAIEAGRADLQISGFRFCILQPSYWTESLNSGSL